MCTAVVLALLAIHNPPPGMVLTFTRAEAAELGVHTRADIKKAQRCCKSRRVVCRIKEDR